MPQLPNQNNETREYHAKHGVLGFPEHAVLPLVTCDRHVRLIDVTPSGVI